MDQNTLNYLSQFINQAEAMAQQKEAAEQIKMQQKLANQSTVVQ